jgi:hypothetical protein
VDAGKVTPELVQKGWAVAHVDCEKALVKLMINNKRSSSFFILGTVCLIQFGKRHAKYEKAAI